MHYRLSFVCKSWNTVANQPELWQNIDLSSPYIKQKCKIDRYFRWLLENRLENIRELNLSKFPLFKKKKFNILFLNELKSVLLYHLNRWMEIFKYNNGTESDWNTLHWYWKHRIRGLAGFALRTFKIPFARLSET